MNFDLTDEQRMLQETVGQLAEKQCPVTEIHKSLESGEHDATLWKALSDLGIPGLAISADYGGAALEVLDLAVVAETLGYHATPGPYLGHVLAAHAISLGGSDEQKKRWLPGLASGERIGTVALAEAGSVWEPDQWALSGEGPLSGTKEFVTSADAADVIVVGLAGGQLGVVEKGAAGLTLEPVDCADLTRRANHVRFENTPCEILASGAAASSAVRDVGLSLLAADAFGGSQRLLDMCVEYAKTREQFGVTIGSFQGLKHQLANMAVEVEPNRGLYWFAAYAQDHVPGEAERVAAIAKAHITDRYMQIARDSVEAHGGIGFTWECDVQIWFKRAMFDRAFLGTPSDHRERSVQLAAWAS
ncbi:MAG: acyl-CoA/acyl-ACP dehydrogenase [Candidatus Binatia bacterium]|nr:acyl-CoA/acyl-ACP dehydrogenase [Candidatus Binatia bacterium]